MQKVSESDKLLLSVHLFTLNCFLKYIFQSTFTSIWAAFSTVTCPFTKLLLFFTCTSIAHKHAHTYYDNKIYTDRWRRRDGRLKVILARDAGGRWCGWVAVLYHFFITPATQVRQEHMRVVRQDIILSVNKKTIIRLSCWRKSMRHIATYLPIHNRGGKETQKVMVAT